MCYRSLACNCFWHIMLDIMLLTSITLIVIYCSTPPSAQNIMNTNYGTTELQQYLSPNQVSNGVVFRPHDFNLDLINVQFTTNSNLTAYKCFTNINTSKEYTYANNATVYSSVVNSSVTASNGTLLIDGVEEQFSTLQSFNFVNNVTIVKTNAYVSYSVPSTTDYWVDCNYSFNDTSGFAWTGTSYEGNNAHSYYSSDLDEGCYYASTCVLLNYTSFRGIEICTNCDEYNSNNIIYLTDNSSYGTQIELEIDYIKFANMATQIACAVVGSVVFFFSCTTCLCFLCFRRYRVILAPCHVVQSERRKRYIKLQQDQINQVQQVQKGVELKNVNEV